MSTASRAVFLSYASEAAPAAQRIAEALRAAGIEVWFDIRVASFAGVTDLTAIRARAPL